jgi:hypothetical protein
VIDASLGYLVGFGFQDVAKKCIKGGGKDKNKICLLLFMLVKSEESGDNLGLGCSAFAFAFKIKSLVLTVLAYSKKYNKDVQQRV